MLSELHAGLHARYLEERQEVLRCTHCGSYNIQGYTDASYTSIHREGIFCLECERETHEDVETFEEWAERKEINIEEL